MFCKNCKTYFSIDHRKKSNLWKPYLDGHSIRTLANGLSFGGIYKRLTKELNLFPYNLYLTKKYCGYTQSFNALHVDGTYVSVKGYEIKIPFIYCIDYLTHDVVHGILASSESYQSYQRLFLDLKYAGYYPHVIISDDHSAIQSAQRDIFSDAKIQLCQTHFLTHVKERYNEKNYEKIKKQLYHPSQISLGLDHRLFTYKFFLDCPKTNNLIELFNSHLKGRLKTVKGFSSFHSAKRFLNAYMVYRRLKPFTDCSPRFDYLNSHCSLEFRLKKEKNIEEIYELLP